MGLISNFQPLRSTNLAIVRAKFVFLDFLEFQAFQAEKNYITFQSDFLTSAAKFKFYLIFGDICS